jgi:hypothetical protein
MVKYRLLFSPKPRGKPGPKGPGKDLIEAVVQMKQRNPAWGCPRIAQQIAGEFPILWMAEALSRVISDTHRGMTPRHGLWNFTAR